jgi:iron complex transport system permease protein
VYALLALAFLVASFLLCLTLGPTSISPARVWEYLWGGAGDDAAGVIFWQLRLPRVLLAFLVGACLAVAGVILQGLLLNPLTDPYVTGVSSGAALGATIGIIVGLSAVWLSVLALVGGGLTLMLVYALGRRRGAVDIYVLLLAGVTLSQLLAAVISVLMIKAGEDMHALLYWILGSFSARGWTEVELALVSLPLLAVPLFYARELNILLQGEQRALELGVDVERVKQVLLLDAAALTAVAASVSGIIGFVGLVIPHLARLITGPDHRKVLAPSVVIGAALMGLSDLAARTIIAPSELPVGVVTTFFGAPLFVYLLRIRRRSS